MRRLVCLSNLFLARAIDLTSDTDLQNYRGCINGGKIKELSGFGVDNFLCLCPDGFEGKQCEYQVSNARHLGYNEDTFLYGYKPLEGHQHSIDEYHNQAKRVKCTEIEITSGAGETLWINSEEHMEAKVACWVFWAPHDLHYKWDFYVNGDKVEYGSPNIFFVPKHIQYMRGMYHDQVAAEATHSHCANTPLQVHYDFPGIATLVYFGDYEEQISVEYRRDTNECFDDDSNTCHIYADCVDLPQREDEFKCECRKGFSDAHPMPSPHEDAKPGEHCIDDLEQKYFDDWYQNLETANADLDDLDGQDGGWDEHEAAFVAEDERLENYCNEIVAAANQRDEENDELLTEKKEWLDEVNTNHTNDIDTMEGKLTTAYNALAYNADPEIDDSLDKNLRLDLEAATNDYNTAEDTLRDNSDSIYAAAVTNFGTEKGDAEQADTEFCTKIEGDIETLKNNIDSISTGDSGSISAATSELDTIFTTLQAHMASAIQDIFDKRVSAVAASDVFFAALSAQRADDLLDIDSWRTVGDSFSAYLDSDWSTAGNVIFDKVTENRLDGVAKADIQTLSPSDAGYDAGSLSGSYDPTTGKFTAQIKGMYYFVTTLKFREFDPEPSDPLDPTTNRMITDAALVYTKGGTTNEGNFRIYYGYPEGTEVDTIALGYHYPALGYTDKSGEDMHTISATLYLDIGDTVWVKLYKNELLSGPRGAECTFNGILVSPDPSNQVPLFT
jgi:hypothetical protein